jgi:hypothetical protein
MGDVKRVQTSQQYFETWIPRLSDTQAESLKNIKQACDVLESYGTKPLNPGAVGKYCQDPNTGQGKVPPAEQTIRNTTIEFEGQFEHVYRNYIQKREAERQKPVTAKGKNKEEAPSYRELAMRIKDDLTRGWVLELVQRWTQAEGSCEWMEKQLREKSREVGGFDLAAAITEGPDENLRLPMMPPNQPSAIEFTGDLRDALEAILSVPENSGLPYLTLNEKGALVYDDTVSGAVVILSPKKWKAIVEAVKGGK